MRHSLKMSLIAGIVLCGQGVQMAYGANPEFDPFAATLDQLNARMGAIETEISRLRSLGQTPLADDYSAQLQHFRDELAGTAASNLKTPELDVLALYGVENGTVSAHIQATDRPIVLTLTAYESLTWNLQIDPGARIDKVILAGFEPQTLTGLPGEIPVQTVPTHGRIFEFSDLNYQFYYRGAKELYELTNAPFTTRQGSGESADFLIGPSNQEWRAQLVFSEMTPLYKQATAYRTAQQELFASKYQSDLIRLMDYDSNTVRTLDGKSYRISGPKVYLTNLSTGDSTVVFDPGEALPGLDIDYITGMAYDSKRNRLVACSYSGEGELFSFSLDNNQWSSLGSLNNADLWALAYFPGDDCFYGLLDENSGETGVRSLLRYNSDGVLIGKVNLSQPIPDYYIPWSNFDMIATGDRLEIVSRNSVDLYEPYLDPTNRYYLINPTSGEVEYSGTTIVVPEPASIFMLIPLALALTRRGNRQTRP